MTILKRVIVKLIGLCTSLVLILGSFLYGLFSGKLIQGVVLMSIFTLILGMLRRKIESKWAYEDWKAVVQHEEQLRIAVRKQNRI